MDNNESRLAKGYSVPSSLDSLGRTLLQAHQYTHMPAHTCTHTHARTHMHAHTHAHTHTTHAHLLKFFWCALSNFLTIADLTGMARGRSRYCVHGLVVRVCFYSNEIWSVKAGHIWEGHTHLHEEGRLISNGGGGGGGELMRGRKERSYDN